MGSVCVNLLPSIPHLQPYNPGCHPPCLLLCAYTPIFSCAYLPTPHFSYFLAVPTPAMAWCAAALSCFLPVNLPVRHGVVCLIAMAASCQPTTFLRSDIVPSAPTCLCSCNITFLDFLSTSCCCSQWLSRILPAVTSVTISYGVLFPASADLRAYRRSMALFPLRNTTAPCLYYLFPVMPILAIYLPVLHYPNLFSSMFIL